MEIVTMRKVCPTLKALWQLTDGTNVFGEPVWMDSYQAGNASEEASEDCFYATLESIWLGAELHAAVFGC